MSEYMFGYFNINETHKLCDAQPSEQYLEKQFKSGYDVSKVNPTNDTLNLCALCKLVLYFPIMT